MRWLRTVLVVGAAAIVVASTFVAVGAFVTGSTGSVIRRIPAPPSAVLGALEDAQSVIVFDEVQGKTLTAPVAIDATAPGTFTVFPTGSATIPAGAVVDSHMVHSDPPGKTKVRRKGSVTFAGTIVGLIGSTSKLAASDAALGAPGTIYAKAMQWRGLEGREGGRSKVPDAVTISPDRKTVTFDERAFVMDEFRVVTTHAESLTIAISDSPDPVTAGNDVQYTVTVSNISSTSVANVHVVDTLPAGTSLVAADAPSGCSGTGPVDCTLGPLSAGTSASARLVVTSPSSVPASGTITNSAVTSPGGVPAVQTTTVEAPQAGVSKGFVRPGDSISITGANPAVLTLPNTGSGAPVIMSQGDGAFCDGPCAGPATTISDFPGYSDANHPIRLSLGYSFPAAPDSLLQAVLAFGSTIYKNIDPAHPNVGTMAPFCALIGGGVAVPHPCVNRRTIEQPTPNSFLVSFEILYLSGDPKFGRR